MWTALFGIGLVQKLFKYRKKNCYDAIQINGKSSRMLLAWTEIYHQFFASWKVQTTWNSRKNVWFIRKACFNKINVYKRAKTCLWHYKLETERQSVIYRSVNIYGSVPFFINTLDNIVREVNMLMRVPDMDVGKPAFRLCALTPALLEPQRPSPSL